MWVAKKTRNAGPSPAESPTHVRWGGVEYVAAAFRGGRPNHVRRHQAAQTHSFPCGIVRWRKLEGRKKENAIASARRERAARAKQSAPSHPCNTTSSS